MAGRTEDPEELSSVLDSLLRERPWSDGMALGELARKWGTIVGDRLARESHPAGVDRGVLLLRASSAAWAAQLTFLEGDILHRANRAVPGLGMSRLRVVLGPPT